MKTLSKVIAAIILVLGTANAKAQDKILTFAQLPVNAQTFVKNTFAAADVILVMEDRENFSKEYKVKFKNGTEVEFDSKGQWKEVDGDRVAIPLKIIPTKIHDHVKKSFPNTTIVKIKKSKGKYEVEISNDLELEFNLKGDFIRIDD